MKNCGYVVNSDNVTYYRPAGNGIAVESVMFQIARQQSFGLIEV